MTSNNDRGIGSPTGSPVLIQPSSSTSLTLDHSRHTSTSNSAKPVHPEFAFPDANVEIETGDQLFRVHEYQLVGFSGLMDLVKGARGSMGASTNHRVKLICKDKSADFYNTFRIIYAAAMFGVPSFDSGTLVSALRIASTYNYPALRSFAISRLEQISLTAIQRIELLDEFQLSEWGSAAFTELRRRAEAITASEALILGIERFTDLAKSREDYQRRQLLQIIDKLAEHYSPLEREHRAYVDGVLRKIELPDSMSHLIPKYRNRPLPVTKEEVAIRTIWACYRRYRLVQSRKQKGAVRTISRYYLRYKLRVAPGTETGRKIRRFYNRYRQDLESASFRAQSIATSRQHKLILLGCMPHVMVYVSRLWAVVNHLRTFDPRVQEPWAPLRNSYNHARPNGGNDVTLIQRLQELVTNIGPGSNSLRHIQDFRNQATNIDELRNAIINDFGREVIPTDTEVHYSLGVSSIHALLSSV